MFLAVVEWNRLIEEVGKLVKADSLLQYISKSKQQQVSTSTGTSLPIDDDGIIDVQAVLIDEASKTETLELVGASNPLEQEAQTSSKKPTFKGKKSWKLLWSWPFPVSDKDSTKPKNLK